MHVYLSSMQLFVYNTSLYSLFYIHVYSMTYTVNYDQCTYIHMVMVPVAIVTIFI